MGHWQAMGEAQIREVLPGEYEDTGSLTQHAYAEYAWPGRPAVEQLRRHGEVPFCAGQLSGLASICRTGCLR